VVSATCHAMIAMEFYRLTVLPVMNQTILEFYRLIDVIVF